LNAKYHPSDVCIIQGKYRKWAKDNSFTSMLAGDIAARKKQNEQAQHTINTYLMERKLTDRVLPYSDKAFMTAAIQWLVSTDQVCFSPHNYIFIAELNFYSLFRLLNIQSSRK
jgi:hypothetical protein